MKLETYNTKKIIALIILIFIFSVFISTPTSAQVIGNLDFLKGLVPCGQGSPTILQDGKAAPNPAFKACTFCHFFVLIQNIINFLLYVFTSLAVIRVVYIAFLFMFSGGSSATIEKAKLGLWHTVIGIAVVLGSWLVINTIINLVVDPAVFPKPWFQINC